MFQEPLWTTQGDRAGLKEVSKQKFLMALCYTKLWQPKQQTDLVRPETEKKRQTKEASGEAV